MVISRRYDDRGPIVLMAVAKGYVMVRRPGCIPFVLTERDWQAMSEKAEKKETDQ